MLTKCPHCGQIHQSQGEGAGDASPPVDKDGMTGSSLPLSPTSPSTSDNSFSFPPECLESPSPEEPEAQHVRTPIPWEERHGILDIGAYWRTTRCILLHPARSFAMWNPPEDMEGALLFLVIFGSLGQILANYWVRFLQMSIANTSVSSDNWIDFGLSVLQAPFLVLVSTFLSGVLMHFFLLLLRGTSLRWTKTFGLFAYLSGALACLQLIPLVGLLITPVWGVVVGVCGLRELHRTDTWRVVVAFLLPLAIFLTLLFVVLLLVVGTGLVVLRNLSWS